MTSQKSKAPFYERYAFIMIGLLITGFLVMKAKPVLDPLMFGFLFAILLLPVSRFLEKKLRFPRALSSIAAILLLVAFISGIVYLVGSQISNLTNDWPRLRGQVNQSVNDLSQWVQQAFHIDASKEMTYVHTTTTKIMASGTSILGQTFGAISSLMLFYAFIIIFTFFFLLYRRQLFNFMVWVFTDDFAAVVADVAENIQSILRQYILGLLLEMCVVAAVACTAFWFIGIKYAVLLGIIIALFNLIPYIGIFTALLLSVLVTFATGNISQAFYVALSILGIHAIDANFLLPTIVGSKVKLNALLTFLGIILGEMIWGLSGMFLSIPTMAILKIIFDRVESLKPWGYLLGSGGNNSKETIMEEPAQAADKS